jgi:Na+/H+ antiporter NhaD/arsenite permease-like protein
MDKKLPKPVAFALIAFMASWQATEFSIDYRAVMGSLTAAIIGYLNPKPATSETSEVSE